MQLALFWAASALLAGSSEAARRGVLVRSLSWSPDGKRIAFTRGLHPRSDVFIMLADSASETALTADGESSLGESVWSRDGTRILFLGGRWPVTDLYTMNADGSGRTRITRSEALDYMASWSPDGSQVLFASNRDVNMRAFVVPPLGGDAVPITGAKEKSTMPQWSPDGKRVVFSSTRDGSPSLYVASADGSHPTRVTSDPQSDIFPRWSPDGKRILFLRGAGDEYDVYVASPQDGEVRRLTQLRTVDPSSPRWSPKADEFLLQHDGDVYIADVNGKVERVTDDAGRNHDATWSPDGSRIAYVHDADSLPEIRKMTVHAPPPAVIATPLAAATETPPGPEEPSGADLTDNPPAEPPTAAFGGDPAKHIRRAAFTTAIADREPVDEVRTLENDVDQILFFTEIVNFEGRTVTHRWRYKGEIKSEVSFEVRGVRWRSYSRKRLLASWTGVWKVEVIDDAGAIMYEASFVYKVKSGT